MWGENFIFLWDVELILPRIILVTNEKGNLYIIQGFYRVSNVISDDHLRILTVIIDNWTDSVSYGSIDEYVIKVHTNTLINDWS